MEAAVLVLSLPAASSLAVEIQGKKVRRSRRQWLCTFRRNGQPESGGQAGGEDRSGGQDMPRRRPCACTHMGPGLPEQGMSTGTEVCSNLMGRTSVGGEGPCLPAGDFLMY